MNKLILADIQNIIEYERSRKPFRERIIALKKNRRISIGESITLVFENRDTVRFQIQEMARWNVWWMTRRFRRAGCIQQIDPRENELSATLMVDIADQSKIAATLDALIGLHRCGVPLDW